MLRWEHQNDWQHECKFSSHQSGTELHLLTSSFFFLMNDNIQNTRAEDYPSLWSKTSEHFALMKAVLPSLKSRFSRPVIKMWQAVADMSIQRHAPRLIMFFNHRTERQQPTRGSFSMSWTPNGLKRVQLNAKKNFFLTQEWLHNVIRGLLLDGLSRKWVRATGSLHPHIPSDVHAILHRPKENKQGILLRPLL